MAIPDNGTTTIAKPGAVSQSSQGLPVKAPSYSTPANTPAKPAQDNDPSKLSQADRIKLQNEHTEYIYDNIISQYDWSKVPAQPVPEPFEPFYFFCSQDLYNKYPDLGKMVAGMNKHTASRTVGDKGIEDGFAWEFGDEKLARDFKAGVEMQKPKIMLGWNNVTVDGSLMPVACRVPILI